MDQVEPALLDKVILVVQDSTLALLLVVMVVAAAPLAQVLLPQLVLVVMVEQHQLGHTLAQLYFMQVVVVVAHTMETQDLGQVSLVD
jgi:hypothetical protein